MDPRSHIVDLPDAHFGKNCSKIDAYCKFLAALLIYDFLRRVLSRSDSDVSGGRLHFIDAFEDSLFDVCQKHANAKLLRRYSMFPRTVVDGLFEPTTGLLCGAHVTKLSMYAMKIVGALRRLSFSIPNDPILERMTEKVFLMRAYGNGLKEAAFIFRTIERRRTGYDLKITIHRQDEIQEFNLARERIQSEVDHLSKSMLTVNAPEELLKRWWSASEDFEKRSKKVAEMLARCETVKCMTWW